jgi:hypothetical protein
LSLTQVGAALAKDSAQGVGELEGTAVGNEHVGERREPPPQRCRRAGQPAPRGAGEQLAEDGLELDRQVTPVRALALTNAELVVGAVGVELSTLGVGATLEGRQDPRADREARVVDATPLDRAQILRDRPDQVRVEHHAERQSSSLR